MCIRDSHYYDVHLKEARLNELEQFENFSFVKGNLADKSVIEAIFEQYKMCIRDRHLFSP